MSPRREAEEDAMSQRNVERIIGRLVTDERFRRRFAEDPPGALGELTRYDCDVTSSELRALASIDPALVERLADSIDPQLQKADLQGGLP
jgi:hypothetical protein